MYFPVIPDNSHDLQFWDRDTSHSVVFHEIIFWLHRSCFIFHMLQIMPAEWKETLQKDRKILRNTFIVVLSVLKFVLGNVQKECLLLLKHYYNHWEFL